ncbi:50S ribosome-binding protein YggL [Burkholderia ubonensis]|uniref:50S ribosome-binding protein YggL n=1 Tax=Burkholderia ubonensis TaxID=101571 RepID=UPI0009B34F18
MSIQSTCLYLDAALDHDYMNSTHRDQTAVCFKGAILNAGYMTKRRNRRQRKKLHLGEFTELGFEVSAGLVSTLADGDRDKLLDGFIGGCIEPLGLSFGGGLNDDLGGYVTSAMRGGSASEDQRNKVREWFSSRPEFSGVEVGPLTDAWRARES